MHYLIRNVFFTVGFAHAVNKMAACLRLDVDQFCKLIEIQVHNQFALVFMHKLIRHQFVHELSLPNVVVLLLEISRLLPFIVH